MLLLTKTKNYNWDYDQKRNKWHLTAMKYDAIILDIVSTIFILQNIYRKNKL